MKRESLTVRLERLERSHRRVQMFALLAVALLASALLAQRGVSQEAASNGQFDELTVKKLRATEIEVTDRLSAKLLKAGTTVTPRLFVQDNGNNGGGSWSATPNGNNSLVMADAQNNVRFVVQTAYDPVLEVRPVTGRQVTIPADAAP
jgi:hypothetical protein